MAKWVVAMLSALEKWKPGPTGRAIQEGIRTPFRSPSRISATRSSKPSLNT